MKRLGVLIIILVIFLASCDKEDKKIDLKTSNDSLSYALGNDIGNSFMRNKLDSLNIDFLAKGIKDKFAEDTSIMDENTVKQVLIAFSKKMKEEAEAERIKQIKITHKDNLDSGQSFLEENSKKEGVITTESGLQYKIIKKGNGNSPILSDKVEVHYEGTLIDGTKFDSSFDRGEPAEFGVTNVIKGWTEALLLMKEGDEWELYIPYDLAYGDRGNVHIKPLSALIFKIHLISIIQANKE